MTSKKIVDGSADRVNRKLRQCVSEEIINRGARGPAPGSGGRPLSGDPKDTSYTLRLTKGELNTLKSAANAEHIAVSEYIRDKLGL